MPALQRPALRHSRCSALASAPGPVGLDQLFSQVAARVAHPFASRLGVISTQLRLDVARCATCQCRNARPISRRARRDPAPPGSIGPGRCFRSAIARAAFPIDPPLLRFLSLQRLLVRVALSASGRLCGRSRFGVGIGPRIPRDGNPMRRPCGFSLPPKLNALDRRVTTESELACAGRSWCLGRRLPQQATAPHASSIFSPASERSSMRDSSAGLPRRSRFFERWRCSLRVMRRGLFLSFPHGVPLPAVSNNRGLAGRCKVSDSAFASGNAPGVHCTLRRFNPTFGWRMRFRITGPTCRSSTSSYPIVFIGPNFVTILYWLVSVIRSRRWSRLLGFAPVCGHPRLGPKHYSFVPRSGFLPWVSSSFRYAGAPTRTVVRTSPWSRHRDDHKPLVRLPGSIRSWVCGAPLRRRVGYTTGSSTCPSWCSGVAGPSAFYEARAWPNRR
jgi:hypothetical protein